MGDRVAESGPYLSAPSKSSEGRRLSNSAMRGKKKWPHTAENRLAAGVGVLEGPWEIILVFAFTLSSTTSCQGRCWWRESCCTAGAGELVEGAGPASCMAAPDNTYGNSTRCTMALHVPLAEYNNALFHTHTYTHTNYN